MSAALADLSILGVPPCEPSALHFTQSLELRAIWHKHGLKHETALIILKDKTGSLAPIHVDLIYDPWLHSGVVIWPTGQMVVSGKDRQTVAKTWFARVRGQDHE